MLTLASRLRLAGSAVNGVSGLLLTLESTSTQSDVGVSVAADSLGNLVVLGRTDTGSILSANLSKITPAGTVLWQRKISMTIRVLPNGDSNLVLDASGNIYVLCQGRDSGSADAPHLVKYNGSGVLQWQRSISRSGLNCNANGLCIDGAGNLYVAIQDVNSPPAQALVKYNSSGTLQWQRAVTTSTNPMSASATAVDSAGNVYLAGTWNNNRGTLRKYTSAGALVFEKYYEMGVTLFYGIAIDGAGNVYLAALASPSGTKPLLVKTDSAGVVIWHRYASAGGQFKALSLTASGVLACSTSALMHYSSAGDLLMQRTLYGTVSATGQIVKAQVLGDQMYFVGSASRTASGNDITAGAFPVSGVGTGAYNWLTYAETTLTSTSGTLNTTTSAFTDAAGTLTDAAGTCIDAAGTLTLSAYSKT